MDKQPGFVTRLELVESQSRLKEDVTKRIEVVDEKVDNLRDVVLPLAEFSKQTAANTGKMADTLERFTDAQRGKNESIYAKMNGHDVEFARLNAINGAKSDDKKSNSMILVAVIGGVVAIVTGLFTLAPYLFN